MKVSIIVSAYKERGWLDDAILSAKAQRFDDFEVILSSDGNPDLRYYAIKHEIKFSLAEKGNHSTALNKAVNLAQGEWIKECHDDDTLDPNCLEDLWSARGDFDILHANAFNFRGDRQWVYRPPRNVTILNLMPVITCPIHAATIFFKREAFLKVGGFDPNVNCSEEYEFYINLFSHGYKFGYCDSVVANYRYHDDSVTKGNTPLKRLAIQEYIVNKHRTYLASL
jgi:glycosyltransferase involved in cell wall biosynthesis